ncbi:hypothetical protein [Curtobacterium sp. MCJR17_020]|uniref:hypothetical protein n=1 Tax=Curtobacterium sp. MCJR17_020 TaxID=2175619 RepID=UPI0015E8DED5|nr:hypothetical protein [Curtobacterium sp. MCJR17_020]WIE72134.1 hypothetical protein DEJ14_018440 [Curtobacterium sp. MCJR17_020]
MAEACAARGPAAGRTGGAGQARPAPPVRSRPRHTESLAEPGILWTREHPEPRRAASAYRNVEVVVEGEWPATEVVVSFEHSDVPYLRLRRRYRVFDEAGHVEDWTYVTVYLDEDIGSGHIALRDEAVDGVLDI